METKTIHELINQKLEEVGIQVTSGIVYVTEDGSDAEGVGQPFIPSVQVKVGDFIVVGKAFLSGELAEQVKQSIPKGDVQLRTEHCKVGEEEKPRRPFRGERRKNALRWLLEGNNRIGTLDHKSSTNLVNQFYTAGAQLVTVVDTVASCNVIRVSLPFDPSEDVSSEEAPLTEQALACIEIMTDLEDVRVQQAGDEQTAFYVLW